MPPWQPSTDNGALGRLWDRGCVRAHLQLPRPMSPFLLSTCGRVAANSPGEGGPAYWATRAVATCLFLSCRKLHSGMKTYGCELCGKRFLDSLRLRMHLLAHSGRRGCPDRPPEHGRPPPACLPFPHPEHECPHRRQALICPIPWMLPPGSWSRKPILTT